MRKLLAAIPLLSLVICLGSCGGGGSSDSVDGDIVNGKEVYTKYCVLCHGEDGKRVVNGAKDITLSVMPFEQRVELITNGKNLMTPFNGILSEKEIKDAAAYSLTIGK